MLYNVVNFWVRGWNPKYDHWNESPFFGQYFSCSTVYLAIRGGSNCWVCGQTPKLWPLKWKHLSSIFPVGAVYHAIMLKRWFYICNFWTCGWNPKIWPFNWKLQSRIITEYNPTLEEGQWSSGECIGLSIRKLVVWAWSLSLFYLITTDFFDSRLFKSKCPWKRFQDFRQSYWWHTIYRDVSFQCEWNSK